VTNVAPNAPTLVAPLGSVTIDYANVQRFSWTFSDPDTGDSQSKYELQYRVVGDTSWITVTETTPNNFYDFPAATFGAHNYEWQVRTYDSLGVVGPWSSSSFFTAATAPSTLSITAPISNATVNALPTFTWSTPTQTDYQIRRCKDISGVIDTGTLYYDSGAVTDAVTRSVSVTMETSPRWEWIQVRIKLAGIWSAYVSVRVYASYSLPLPGVVVVVANETTASLEITTSIDSIPGPTPISLELYVREIGTTGDGDRVYAEVSPTGLYIWWTPASGKDYEIRSRTTADNGAQRWSALFFNLVYDGGLATPGVREIYIDGGSATAVSSNLIDGGNL
jgi:hypothetical protein